MKARWDFSKPSWWIVMEPRGRVKHETFDRPVPGKTVHTICGRNLPVTGPEWFTDEQRALPWCSGCRKEWTE